MAIFCKCEHLIFLFAYVANALDFPAGCFDIKYILSTKIT